MKLSAGEHGIWNDILQSVRAQIPEVEYRTWFEQVSPVGFADGSFWVGRCGGLPPPQRGYDKVKQEVFLYGGPARYDGAKLAVCGRRDATRMQ